MALLTTPALELTDELAGAFLEELSSSGSTRRAARAIGVDLHLMYQRRWRDQEFRDAWDAARRRRLREASDELFAAIDRLGKLIGGEEHALDELINVTFGAEEYPRRRGVCPARLAAAREQLREAGKRWAAAVVSVESPRELERTVA